MNEYLNRMIVNFKGKDFKNFAKEKKMIGIAGHRSVGGFRASLYNALPLSSVKTLADIMRQFTLTHG